MTRREAVAPPEWEETVKKMKKHPEIDNPWALAWSMKNKGYTPGGKDKKADMDELINFQDAVTARRVAKVHPTEKARRDYLFDHPAADPKNHHVQTEADKGRAKAERDKAKSESAEEVAELRKERKALKKQLSQGANIDDPQKEKRIEEINAKIKQLQKPKKKKEASDALANFQDALLARVAKEHPSEKARRDYLHDHPKADPKDHTVQKPKGKGKDVSDQEGFEGLKGLSHADQQKAIQRALKQEKDDAATEDRGRRREKVKDQSTEDMLKGLSPKARKRVLERALKMSNMDALTNFQDHLMARRVARRVMSMEHDTEEARKKYLKDHPQAEARNHTVKKQKEEPKREKNEWAQAADQVAKEQVKGVGSHMAPYGVVPLKDDKHDAPGIAKDHTRKQIEESLSNVKAQMKYLNISDEPPKGMSEDEAEDDKYTDEKQGGSWRKTKKTLEKALKLKGDKDD